MEEMKLRIPGALNTRTSTANNNDSAASGTGGGAKSTNTGETDASTKSSIGHQYATRSSSVVWGRAIFLLFLLLLAGLLGFLSYYFLAESEHNLVEEQYYAMTSRALEATRSLTVCRRFE